MTAEILFSFKKLTRTQKKLAEVNSWENTQKAKVEAKLKKVEVIKAPGLSS